jgi:hypothetical protein
VVVAPAWRVPVRDYEGFRPYVGRIAKAPSILTDEAPFMFTTTSGTTGQPKLIPVTRSWRDETAALMRLWTYYALRDHPLRFSLLLEAFHPNFGRLHPRSLSTATMRRRLTSLRSCSAGCDDPGLHRRP